MLTQTKQLKKALKNVGIVDRNGGLPSVRTEKLRIPKGKGAYEYGSAIAHTVNLTDQQISDLKNISSYFNISNHPDCGFAIVKN